MVEQGQCKIDRVINQYGLNDPQHASVDGGLLARWHGEGNHREYGYRTLTDWFNKRVMRTVYEEHGRKTLGNRIESDYAGLTGTDDIVRNDIRSDVEADGIPVDDLIDDLVSWGTMQSHLKTCLDGNKAPEQSTSNWERDAIRKARDVAKQKANESLSSLAANGEIEDGASASVDIEIRLRCGECPTTVPFEVAAQRGYVCETHRETAAVASTSDQ